jgi:spore germination cell wall hydrolase CwlJ-like protein
VNPTPAPFRPEWLSPGDLETATDCMAQAVYYEANSEPFAGQLAVAQVILNRLRHPRFPKTVCGVIHQGSERTTGCQFTFACDGSLARKPDPAGLQRARTVAQAALHGAVSAQAGQATHYHTIWIVPVWAAELRKVAIVSHHVFYRPPAFYAGYALTPVMQISPDLAQADQTMRAPPQPMPGEATAQPRANWP